MIYDLRFMNLGMSKNYKLKIKNSKKGFSLIELLLYMGIFSILIVVLFQLLTSIFDFQLESESASSVTQDGRFIVNKLAYDVPRAATISEPLLGLTGQSLTILDGVNSYTYSLSSGNLIVTQNPGSISNQLNSLDTTVSNLNFYHLADNVEKNDTITVTFTLTSKIKRRGQPNSLDYRTTVGLRAP